MDKLPILITDKIWRYNWKEKKQKFLNDIAAKNHKLLVTRHPGPAVGIYFYPFALHPVEHQPSGTCNFSRINKATLNLL
jgi:hypothetical protein